MENYFAELNKIDCSGKTEKKQNLTYLSWAWAWGELKKRYPLSYYTIYENKDGWNYFTDGNTAWVKTGVTVVFEKEEPIEHIEYLPIMDFKNKSIPVEAVTSFDVNKTIQRSLTKAVARHGLGLYIYAGEDLPEESDGSAEQKVAEVKGKKAVAEPATQEMINTFKEVCERVGLDKVEIIKQAGWKAGAVTKAQIGKANQLVKKYIEENEKHGDNTESKENRTE